MNFAKKRKKAQRIRQERALLLVYALAVTAALIISVYNNNNVEASTPYDVEVEKIVPEEFIDMEADFATDNLKDDEILDDVPLVDEAQTLMLENDEPKSLQTPAQEVVASNSKHINHDVITVAKGDSFIGILTGLGLDYAKATDIYTAYKKVFDAKNIKVGQSIFITSAVDNVYNELVSIDKIVIEPISGTRYIVEQNDDGKYEARIEQDDLKTDIKSVSGIIKGNVSSAMQNAGVPLTIVGNFINIFSFSVDFRRDVKAGDTFEVRYEQELAPNGKVVKYGDIIYASLKLGKEKTELYRFEDSKGNVDYYDEKGLALKKTLDKKPLAFKNARISSRFGRRLHPIFKDYRNHHGVDYAAPMGTKVYASGDGVVTQAKWVGGYGYFVKIRHNSEYTTGYAHLKSFAKGIRPGVRVKQGQVIAYVGNTGRSTGPHLHFEVIKNGQKVDPLKIRAATGENLSGAKLAEFKKVVAQIKQMSVSEQEVAKTDKIGEIIDGLEEDKQI
ncbi:MAG: hypothetical protein E7016_03125 [Alphaproteobacteria bacterium]|nr:hypothetical protein [Alphaproteobacteria bacterium]